MENIGEKIMQARKTKGMTQDTLAQLVNVFLADEAAEDAAVQPPEAVPTVQEPVQETQEQTDGRFVNPPEQPKQPNQRKRIAVICAAVVIIVAAVVGIVLPMLPKAQAQIELSYPPENAYMMKEDDGFVAPAGAIPPPQRKRPAAKEHPCLKKGRKIPVQLPARGKRITCRASPRSLPQPSCPRQGSCRGPYRR